MTTQQETMRKLINLLESTEQSDDGEKKQPLTPKEQAAIADLADALGSLEENWKKVAAGSAVALAALFTNLAHAADPAGLIDTTTEGTAAQSCSMILNTALSSGMVPQELLGRLGQARTMADKLALDARFNPQTFQPDPKRMQQQDQSAQATKAKINRVVNSGDRAAVIGAAGNCIRALG